MSTVRRLLTAAGATVAIAAAGLTVAAPAHATPLGCVGSSEIPSTYVCVDVYPENVQPTFGTQVQNVHVYPLCLLVTCTDPSDREVTYPTVNPNEGNIVELTYMGQIYAIGLGSIDTANTLAGALITAAAGVADQGLVVGADLAQRLTEEFTKIKVCGTNGCGG